MPYASVGGGTQTKNDGELGRLQVDSQQTSFEDNAQFKIVYYMDGSTNADDAVDIIIKVEVGANAINLINKTLQTWTGGRAFYVYTSGTASFTDSSTPTPSPINRNPTNKVNGVRNSDVTITMGYGTFTSDDENRTGTPLIALSGTGSSRGTAFNPNEEKQGVESGLTFYYVGKDISSNSTDTEGAYSFSWEELF